MIDAGGPPAMDIVRTLQERSAGGLETRIDVTSDEPADRIRMDEQTCFTLGALTEPVPTTTVATRNGEELTLED